MASTIQVRYAFLSTPAGGGGGVNFDCTVKSPTYKAQLIGQTLHPLSLPHLPFTLLQSFERPKNSLFIFNPEPPL